jgi:hypothetical protein
LQQDIAPKLREGRRPFPDPKNKNAKTDTSLATGAGEIAHSPPFFCADFYVFVIHLKQQPLE